MLSVGLTSLVVFGPLAAYVLVLVPLLWWAERRQDLTC